ncbi:MAG: GGDEF domain-containing protein [Spirochaetales bacterium]|nr:GGDEF domain-containing protein [Spirochaetales bacterium]
MKPKFDALKLFFSISHKSIPPQFYNEYNQDRIIVEAQRIFIIACLCLVVLPLFMTMNIVNYNMGLIEKTREFVISLHIIRISIWLISLSFVILFFYLKKTNSWMLRDWINFAFLFAGFFSFGILSAYNLFFTSTITGYIVIILIASIFFVITPLRRLILFTTSLVTFLITSMVINFDQLKMISNISNFVTLYIFSYILSIYVYKNFLRDFINTQMIIAQRDELHELALIDSLTNLHNRRYFNQMFEREVAFSIREKKPLSIIILDVDNFKQYNDTYGHIKGDECLVEIANILSTSIKRKTDILARFGGEEFVIILPATDLQGCEIVARRLIENVYKARIPGVKEFYVTISAGCASSSSITAETAEKLLISADNMLYKAKDGGKNQIFSIQV